MMIDLMAEQVQESSASTPPGARQTVGATRPPEDINPSTQLDMPPWEPTKGTFNNNTVNPHPLGMATEGPRGPPPTMPSGPSVRPPNFPGQLTYATVDPSPYPYPYGTPHFPHYTYPHPQYNYTTPSGYYNPNTIYPGSFDLPAHPTPGYIFPHTQPIPIPPPFSPFPRSPPISSGGNPLDPPNIPLPTVPTAPSPPRGNSISNLQGCNLEQEFDIEAGEHSATSESVERSEGRDSSKQSRLRSGRRAQFVNRHHTVRKTMQMTPQGDKMRPSRVGKSPLI